MTNIYLLHGLVAFWPDKNLLISTADESHNISLSNPATRCLLLLIQHHGSVVERDYFFQHVWENNGAQVTNNAFYQNISLLRRAFKELGLNEEWIVTVPKVGIKLENTLRIEVQQQAEEKGVPEPSVRAPGNGKLVIRVWLTLAVFFACLAAGVMTWRSEFQPRFTQYVPLNERMGCHYYANPDVLDFDKHRQVIQTQTFDCQNYPWTYITLYPNFSRISVIACREQYGAWRENACAARYIFMEDRHVDS
jgi:DNA-binding winged helix-turn-helix (wHTH) protein